MLFSKIIISGHILQRLDMLPSLLACGVAALRVHIETSIQPSHQRWLAKKDRQIFDGVCHHS
jgi:hypothetical protein